MVARLIRKLEQFVRLSGADRRALERIASRQLRHVDAGRDIIREGDAPQVVRLFVDGWACRYKQLEDGRQQIVGFFLPGDLCDLHVFILRRMDHSIRALTPVTVAEISREVLDRATLDHPRITQALWWENLVSTSIQREWTLNVGQRDAAERVAHLLCELFTRLRSVGLTEGRSCEFPLTQAALAEATGLSTVHVNRTLRLLRESGLAVISQRRLVVPDLDALMLAALFNPNYLHLEHEGRHLDANS